MLYLNKKRLSVFDESLVCLVVWAGIEPAAQGFSALNKILTCKLRANEKGFQTLWLETLYYLAPPSGLEPEILPILHRDGLNNSAKEVSLKQKSQHCC